MSPDRVAVVGAGIVGLSTAWFLQEYGVEVVVLDRSTAGSGASHSNAGWIMPSRAVPLTEPSALREGLAGLVRPHAPFAVSSKAHWGTWQFLARFARSCTPRRWAAARVALTGLNDRCLAAYDELTAAEHDLNVTTTPTVAVFRDRAEATHLTPGADLRDLPKPWPVDLARHVSEEVEHAVEISGTRYVDPAHFTRSLADAVIRRGGRIESGVTVTGLGSSGRLETDRGAVVAERTVIATGAALEQLARPLGVRTMVRAGRGYSFTVAVDEPVPSPVYLPAQRIACTPTGSRLRVAGVMEFASRHAPPNQARMKDMTMAAHRLLKGVRWDDRADEWLGERPVTSDGLPLIGQTTAEDVYVAGGHAMWGMTQGPATGQLLAQWIATGHRPSALLPFDPLR